MTRRHRTGPRNPQVKTTIIIREEAGPQGCFVAWCDNGAVRVGVKGWRTTTSKLPEYLAFIADAPGMTDADFQAGVYRLMSAPQTDYAVRKK